VSVVELLDLLRSQPVLAGPLPRFDPGRAPDEPGELFVQWLEQAVAAGVPEPHVVTLSTADARGRPSSRVLMLRDVDVAGAGWRFASGAASRKGVELAANPWAALSVYWPKQGRQVRVAGRVEAASAQESAADFHTRSPAARIAALTGQQSAPLSGPEEFEAAHAEAEKLVAGHPEAVAADHTVYTLWAVEAEFWQGDAERRHVRLSYVRGEGGAWTRQLLWP
jgi:pyridoxamine 5'-phosphate oxidase